MATSRHLSIAQIGLNFENFNFFVLFSAYRVQKSKMLNLSHINVEDVATSGRPKEAVSDENIKKVHKIILSDRKVKLIEIAETLKISKKRVEHIVHEYLDMQKRVDDSEQFLAIFNRNKDGFSVDILQWM
jgi:hypothetical protein